MDVLNSVVAGMGKEEVRYFKLFQQRSNRNRDRMDSSLFDYMRKSGADYEEEKIMRKLYRGRDKNAFYRLRNRLLSDLKKSLLLQHFEEDEAIHALHLLALSKFFFNRNNIPVAHYFLRKAQTEAVHSENHELLDIIYSDFIRISNELLVIDPGEYIDLRRKNREEINHLREIDDVLAMVSYRMKVTQNFDENENPILPLLQKTVSEFTTDRVLMKSPRLRFRIYHAVSQILLQKRDYPSLEIYLMNTFQEFNTEKLFGKANHDTRLQMLVFIINTLFKNNKLEASLEYTRSLKRGMEEYQRMHYDKYLFYYYNSLVINYSKLNKRKAIDILNEMKENPKIRSNAFHTMFVYLNLAVSYFDLHDYHASIRNLNRLYLLDAYGSTDIFLKFKIAIAELMIRYELKDFDVLEQKIRLIRKNFREVFNKRGSQREVIMVEVLEKLITRDNLKKEKSLMSRVKSSVFRDTETDAADSEILNYKNWLNEKL